MTLRFQRKLILVAMAGHFVVMELGFIIPLSLEPSNDPTQRDWVMDKEPQD